MDGNLQKQVFTANYKKKLELMSVEIRRASEVSKNEATVASAFEITLYSFINNNLGLNFLPEKEKTVNKERHIRKGRIDSKYGALVIEFKHRIKLRTGQQKHIATKQLKNYLEWLYEDNPIDYLGLITDGISCKFVRNESGDIFEEAWNTLKGAHLDRLIKTIILLDQIALTSENLIRDFCEPLDDNLAKRLSIVFCKTLNKQMKPKTRMLFEEWLELFKLSHDDTSKQRDIQERRKELSNALSIEIKNNEEEYMALYSLQTTYALIVKLIAFKVISKLRFDDDFIDFRTLGEAENSALRQKLSSLEDGEIFRQIGISNLLEGDFFSWYVSQQQWNREFFLLISEVIQILSKYEDKVLVHQQTKTNDLFKELYQKIIPPKVRHSLGEFYTPAWLADNLILEGIKISKCKKDWKLLDPTAGSGTFLVVGIQKVLEAENDIKKDMKLKSVLCRIKGFDLNPLSVLTTRVNYFVNIAHLIEAGSQLHLHIPVYLGDSSYVPEPVVIDNVECLSYKIKTLKGHIDVTLPKNLIINSEKFSKVMEEVEYDIKSLDWKVVAKRIKDIASKENLTSNIERKIDYLAQKFVELEKNEWNGIWARIVTNFLTTASLGKFDLIVGNPPWVDWKNLPEGYRERIKSLCIARHLFSGDRITGGINLNICALIANVAADNWLKKGGVLAFLMPQNLLLLQTYEGFRNFYQSDNTRLYFQQFYDWTKSGHPFQPVQHKFLTYFISNNIVDYKKGLPITVYEKKSGKTMDVINRHSTFNGVENSFVKKDRVVGQCIKGSTIFTYADSSEELNEFKLISGESYYIGREGIEFYPQELFLLQIANTKADKEHLYFKNFQNDRSKYKISEQIILLEKEFLHPLVKGVNIERYHINEEPNFVVPFPYDPEYSTRIPIQFKVLRERSPLLAKYFLRFKKVFEEQTEYNDRIIGKNEKEFYALARVGKYSFAEHYVAFRDNTKWQAAVVSERITDWSGKRRPQFQNHAVSISERKDGKFITEDEAHYICSILNAPITQKFILNSSDSRTFKIRPPVFVPKYSNHDQLHCELSALSRKAHKNWHNKELVEQIDKQINMLYLKLAKRDNK